MKVLTHEPMSNQNTARITGVDVIDIRFPTSRELDGARPNTTRGTHA
ncbi:hypothetical protein B7755_001815 [Streptomyces sp. NBS 14/10]|nr:hypothetical protein [Streptomyces sp. NBS 14/10]KAK1177013.1 hypothetical protein B7755_001815 [Streptomyces sp. NBS 14/10]NUS87920.1 hypothetical protein [Streptomyces sp.]